MGEGVEQDNDYTCCEVRQGIDVDINEQDSIRAMEALINMHRAGTPKGNAGGAAATERKRQEKVAEIAIVDALDGILKKYLPSRIVATHAENKKLD